MGEKTEKASPKKLRDARKKGQVAKSQDAPQAVTFIVSIATTIALAGYLYDNISEFLISCFSSVGNPNLTEVVLSFFVEANLMIFKTAIPIMLVTAVVGILTNFLLIGPVVAMEAFKPDIKKFNPVTNIKNKFKMKTLVELLKQIIKISVAVYLIYGVVHNSIGDLIATVDMPMSGAMHIYASFLIEVVKRVGLFFLIIAIADFAYQKKVFAKEMMMEKYEQKQEYKSTEGDPQIKGKRKQIAQEIAFSDPPERGVREAKAVVVNPIHIAVAIGYEEDQYALPFICAMGQDTLAQLIVKEAENYDVPVLRNIGLAHDLYDNGEVWEFIPEAAYEPVAEILRWIAAIEAGDTNAKEPGS